MAVTEEATEVIEEATAVTEEATEVTEEATEVTEEVMATAVTTARERHSRSLDLTAN